MLLTSIIVIIIAYIIESTIVYFLFRGSVVHKVAVGINLLIAMVAIAGVFVGMKGPIHLAWAAPIVIVACVVLYASITKRLSYPLREITEILTKLGEKDLTVSVDEKLHSTNNEIKDITVACENLIAANVMMMKKLQENSDSMLTLGKQINDSSNSISDGATNQACSIEEISTSIEEITSNIMSNSDSALKTSDIANKSYDKLLQTMDKVSDAADYIEKINLESNVVTDISSQTNILALNASIEAVKAGNYGKSFGVVASEVRKLAKISEDSAYNINQLIGSGTRIVNEIKDEIQELNVQTSETTELITHVADASGEMSIGANQINTTIQNINNVIQENAASSEELSASAEQLFNTAESFSELISEYKI